MKCRKVNDRISAAVRRSAIRSASIHLRRRLSASAKSVMYPIRAARTAAQPPGSSAISSSTSRIGWSTATTSAAVMIPAAPVTQSRTLLTSCAAARVPRSRARCMAS
jgi:hypothetical protein